MKVDNAKSVVAPLHPESLRKGFTEIPRITENYENWRRDRYTDFPADRHEQIIDLMKEAIDYYGRHTRQKLPEYVRST